MMIPQWRHIVLVPGMMLLSLLHAWGQYTPVVTHTGVITTSMGAITFELYGNDAPLTVKNIVKLIDTGYYKGILIHRVVPGFVIQFGDPKTRDTALQSQWGSGGESIYGGPFADELNPNAPSYVRGYIEGVMAMANRGPGTNTSQLFIMLVDNAKLKKPLDHFYTIFGKVTSGMNVVHAIEKVEVINPRFGIPKKPITIINITVAAKP
jgi:peptidylprolyl isomerase/peptidyl-prolyl cis-trans isomerase-like 1